MTAETQTSDTEQKLKDILDRCAAHFRQGRYQDFQEEIAKAREIDAEHPQYLHLSGLFALQAQNDIKKAYHLVARAAKKLPKSLAVHHNLATILITRGEFHEAEKKLLAIVQKKPDYAEAFHTLAGIRKFFPDDPVISMMENLAKTTSLSPTDASFLCFALAKAYDDVGDYDRAWQVLEQGNALMEEQYDPAFFDTGLDQIRSVYTAEFIAEKETYGHPTHAPIFIVGMPRSGTTLLESVLGANPLIFNAGELPALPTVGRKMAAGHAPGQQFAGYANALKALPDDHLRPAAQAYLNYAHARSDTWIEYFTDKLPDNSFNIGLAATLFPNAKFINLERNPLDVVLSIYFQRFTNLHYGFRLDTICRHYRNYRAAMDHWRSVLGPDRLFELSYEELVEDSDSVFETIHDKLGIEKAAFLTERTAQKSTVSTASRWQARQPIYTSSKEKWRRYEKFLTKTEAIDLL